MPMTRIALMADSIFAARSTRIYGAKAFNNAIFLSCGPPPAGHQSIDRIKRIIGRSIPSGLFRKVGEQGRRFSGGFGAVVPAEDAICFIGPTLMESSDVTVDIKSLFTEFSPPQVFSKTPPLAVKRQAPAKRRDFEAHIQAYSFVFDSFLTSLAPNFFHPQESLSVFPYFRRR